MLSGQFLWSWTSELMTSFPVTTQEDSWELWIHATGWQEILDSNPEQAWTGSTRQSDWPIGWPTLEWSPTFLACTLLIEVWIQSTGQWTEYRIWDKGSLRYNQVILLNLTAFGKSCFSIWSSLDMVWVSKCDPYSPLTGSFISSLTLPQFLDHLG